MFKDCLDILRGEPQMKNNMDDESEDLSQKIMQEIKSVYGKCRNTALNTFQSTFDIIKNNSVYRKLRKNRKFIYKIIGGTVVSLALTSFIFLKVNNSYIAYSVEIDDDVLAVVRDENDFADALETVKRFCRYMDKKLC